MTLAGLWFATPALALALGSGTLPIVGWLAARNRPPCPLCGKRSSRTIREVHGPAGGFTPRALTYECGACGGVLRYARRPDGREFWVPAGEGTDPRLAEGAPSDREEEQE